MTRVWSAISCLRFCFSVTSELSRIAFSALDLLRDIASKAMAKSERVNYTVEVRNIIDTFM